jgi:hypothetical protein
MNKVAAFTLGHAVLVAIGSVNAYMYFAHNSLLNLFMTGYILGTIITNLIRGM